MQREVILPVSVLMPVCNEVDIISGVLDEWLEDVLQYLPSSSELVLEDSSTDGTTEILHDYARRFDFIRVHTHPKDGFFNAAMRAYRRAACPLTFFTDSDGQYVPRQFWKIAAQIENFDMVHGVKRNRCDPLYRVAASRCFNWTSRRLTGFPGRDINSAFRLIRRNVLDALLGKLHVMPTLLNAELYLRARHAGYRILDVDVEHRRRKYGKSRGLPCGRFLHECSKAYQGLHQLKRELAKPDVVRWRRGPVGDSIYKEIPQP
jgi:glycosyltransferase involved in cell wall biosynthesis